MVVDAVVARLDDTVYQKADASWTTLTMSVPNGGINKEP